MPVESQLAAEAVQAVQMTLRMRLTAPEWTYFDVTSATLAEAFEAGDERALREAVLDLDEMAWRAKRRLGQEPDEDDETEAPTRSRDSGYELIHRITPAARDNRDSDERET